MAAPSDAADAKGALLAAVRDDDPVIVLCLPLDHAELAALPAPERVVAGHLDVTRRLD